jgi:ankyrin repeat protein
MTGYHISSQYGCVEFAKLLDRYGADHNAVDNNKKTPLNYAI